MYSRDFKQFDFYCSIKMPNYKAGLPELLTIKQVSKVLNVSIMTLRRWDKNGKLKAIRVGTRSGVGERRYLREDIIKLITGI